jgi:hypothetical protein
VDTVFAYPGGASMEIHQALTRSETVSNILCRHEQASRRCACERETEHAREPRLQGAGAGAGVRLGTQGGLAGGAPSFGALARRGRALRRASSGQLCANAAPPGLPPRRARSLPLRVTPR